MTIDTKFDMDIIWGSLFIIGAVGAAVLLLVGAFAINFILGLFGSFVALAVIGLLGLSW